MLSRSERQWQILVSEYKACRTKLQSKREAHQIMLKMLSEHDKEKELLQTKLRSLETAAEELISGNDVAPNLFKFGGLNVHSEKGRNVVQSLILHVSKMQKELDKKTQLLADVTSENSDLKKDLKAVRADKIGFNRVISPVLDNTDRDREDFLAMIQSLKQEVEVCNTRIKTLNDEATDFRIEREFYKQKVKTLTEQLLEKNEFEPIAEVEQLLVENRELRDKVDKLQHINAALVSHNTLPHTSSLHSRPRTYPTTTTSYPSSIKKKSRAAKWSKHVTFEHEEEERSGFIRSVKEKVKVETELQHLQTLIQDMQKVSNGLAETVLDKSTALKHQRASNRLLGERVTELEAKLRALEMSGFWSVPEGYSGSGDENKRDQLRRLTLSGGGGGASPEHGADLLLDQGSGEEGAVMTSFVTSSSRDTLLLCQDEPPELLNSDAPDELTQLLTRTEQQAAVSSNDCSDTLNYSSDHLTSPSEPLLPSCDTSVSHDDHLGDTLLDNSKDSDDDLMDLLPVKERDV